MRNPENKTLIDINYGSVHGCSTSSVSTAPLSGGASDRAVFAAAVDEDIIPRDVDTSLSELGEFMARYYEGPDMKPTFLKLKKGGMEAKAIDHGIMAHFLCDNPAMRCCKVGGTMAIRDGRRYNVSPDAVKRAIVRETEAGFKRCGVPVVHDDGTREFRDVHIGYSTKIADRKEVFDYLHQIMVERKPADARYITFANGTLDVEKYMAGDDDCFTTAIDPDLVIVNIIPHDWNPDIEPVEVVDNMLDTIACDRPNVRASLEEMMGHCIYRDKSKFENMPSLHGEAGNGKSTIFDFVEFIVGEENCSRVKLQDFAKAYSSVHTIAGKLVNIDDDVSSEYLKGKVWSMVKPMSGGKRQHVDVKYDPNGVDFTNTATLLLATNSMFSVSSRDAGQAVQDRIVFIPCDARIRDTDKHDPDFKAKLMTEDAATYALKLAVDGLCRLLKNGRKFSIGNEADELVRQFVTDNDSFEAWIDDTGYDARRFTSFDPDARPAPADGVAQSGAKGPMWDIRENPFDDYKRWCTNNGRESISGQKFSRRVNKKFGLQRTEPTYSSSLRTTYKGYVPRYGTSTQSSVSDSHEVSNYGA